MKKLNEIFKSLNINSNSNFFDIIIDDGSHIKTYLITFKDI